MAEKDVTIWEKILHETNSYIQDFSNTIFSPYPDSSIDNDIGEAMLEDSSLRKKVRLASIFSNNLSSDIANLNGLLNDTIELRSYPEAARVQYHR